jgi:hypothetical protein
MKRRAALLAMLGAIPGLGLLKRAQSSTDAKVADTVHPSRISRLRPRPGVWGYVWQEADGHYEWEICENGYVIQRGSALPGCTLKYVGKIVQETVAYAAKEGPMLL